MEFAAGSEGDTLLAEELADTNGLKLGVLVVDATTVVLIADKGAAE